ncbi:hypothetical protein K470DRAFT_260220 [Piedraia hortae CBS 480.64]|uniref:Fucose-specific lectin n=1 Tax=Piedraia hortae CBS 480.64 TaxID=1314780 RepID=A0A6A7BS58_9PEZI|nr:hypothetical protein K470DRAFT_260220 [Piedraia hortae CBS 480.64]
MGVTYDDSPVTSLSTGAPIPLSSEKELDARARPAGNRATSGLIPFHSVHTESAEKEALYNPIYPNGYPYNGQPPDQQRKKKQICGISRKLCLSLLLLLLILIGLGVGLGVGLGTKKSSESSTKSSSGSPASTPSAGTASVSSSLSSSALPTAKRFDCGSRPASSRKAKSGTGIAFASQPQGQVSSDGSQTVANLYYQNSNSNALRAHQLWGNGSWTDNEIPIGSSAMSKTPLAAVSIKDNDTVTWNLFYVDAGNFVQHFSYQDPGFKSHSTIYLDFTARTQAYTEGRAGITVCPIYYSFETLNATFSSTSTDSPLDRQGMVLWHGTNSTRFVQWLWRTESDAKPTWGLETDADGSFVQKGMGCASSLNSSITGTMFVNTTWDWFQFYSEDMNSQLLGVPNNCGYTSSTYLGEEFVKNDGELFYTQNNAGIINVHTIVNAWDCSSTKRDGKVSQLGSQPAIAGTRLDATTVYNGSDVGESVVVFQSKQGNIIGCERDKEGNWSGGADVLQC